MKKKRKLNRIGKITILSMILVIVGIIILIICFTNHSEKEFHIIEKSNKYTLKISYPNVKNKKLNKEIKNYVLNQKKEFLASISDLEISESGELYDFSLQYQVSKKENIESYHLVTYSFSGGNHYIREDASYHYDTKDNQLVDINYFLEDDQSLSKLSVLSYYYVMKQYEEKEQKGLEEWVKTGTAADIHNYQNFSFNETGLAILFPPYQVGPWSEGEINITIPYSELVGIIKEQYRNYQKEESPIITPEIRDVEQFKDKKLIAFTFDDGPSTVTTNKLLDGLHKYNAKVTFFVLGSRINGNKDVLIRAYKEGNQIGSHTYNHLNLLKLDEYQVLKEIKSTNEEVKKVLGMEPTLLRPPYGNTNSEIKQISNMNTILWNIDTLDWKYKDKYKIADEIVEHAHDGAIVLLHDIYNSSVEGALLAMERLQKEGYAFVTIEEMTTLKNIDLAIDKSYYNF